MADRSPRPLADVLTYLDGIGYDGLYLNQPAVARKTALPASEAPAGRPSRQSAGVAGSATPARQAAAPRAAAPRATAPRATAPRDSASQTDELKADGAATAAPATAAPATASSVYGSAARETAPPVAATEDVASGTVSTSVPTATVPPAGGISGGLADGPGELDGEQRFQRLSAIEATVRECTACNLCRGRKNTVFGSGNVDADLMLIGEGPGGEEDRKGLPFVGPAGALLTRIIEAIDLGREDVYIANMVKCRPPNNRDPLPAEVDACRGYLHEQIALVRPKVIVALGRVAAQALLESDESLGRLRGRWHDVRGVATRTTYHPAALLRYAKYKRPTWEDMKVVRDRLHALRG